MPSADRPSRAVKGTHGGEILFPPGGEKVCQLGWVAQGHRNFVRVYVRACLFPRPWCSFQGARIRPVGLGDVTNACLGMTVTNYMARREGRVSNRDSQTTCNKRAVGSGVHRTDHVTRWQSLEAGLWIERILVLEGNTKKQPEAGYPNNYNVHSRLFLCLTTCSVPLKNSLCCAPRIMLLPCCCSSPSSFALRLDTLNSVTLLCDLPARIYRVCPMKC